MRNAGGHLLDRRRRGVGRAHLLPRPRAHPLGLLRNDVDAIEQAQSEILIANAYFFPGRRFRQALVEWAQSEGMSWAFAFKTLLTIFIALWVSYRLELPQPTTVLATVIIVIQPQSGQVFAKSFYRFLGTLAGSAVMVLLIALFAQNTELFLGALAIWVGICTAGATRNRNFRAYGFVLAGYTAAMVGLPALALFLIIFLWTPPHFWALACYRRDEYARAGLPMLPVSHGVPLTCLHILLYTVLLAAVSYLPATLGLSGGVYVGLVSLLNLGYLREAWRLWRDYSDKIGRASCRERVSSPV